MGLLLAQTICPQIKSTQPCYLVCQQSLFGLDHSFFTSHLAPGASTLLTLLADGSLSGHHSIDTSKPVREMDVQDWAALVQVFHSWPFAPDVSYNYSLLTLHANLFHNSGFAYNRLIFS